MDSLVEESCKGVKGDQSIDSLELIQITFYGLIKITMPRHW